MATLATQNITRAGLSAAAFSAASGGGDRFTPGSQTWLEVNNGGGSPITVTVTDYKVPLPNMTESNVVVSCPAGQVTRIGPFPADRFTALDGTGLGSIAYSGVTSVTVAVVACPQP